MRAAVSQQADLMALSYSDRTDVTYGAEQDLEKAYVQYVSGWMFDSFGLQPALGRLLTESDDVNPARILTPSFLTTIGRSASDRIRK